MVFWQFVVLAILMGGLLLCAGVLTRTLVYTNYRLKKLEEALLVRDRPIRHAEARATEMQQRVVAGKDGASYLTIRDLKSRGKRPSAHPRRSSSRSSPRIPESLGPLRTTRVPEPVPVSAPECSEPMAESMEAGEPIARRTEARPATTPGSEQVSSGGTRQLNGDLVAANLEVGSARETISEPAAPDMRPIGSDSGAPSGGDSTAPSANDSTAPSASSSTAPGAIDSMGPSANDSATPSSQSNGTAEMSGELLSAPAPANETPAPTSCNSDAPETTSESLSPSNQRRPVEDPVAKKKREVLLLLNSQRRRRRARLGY